MNKSLMDKIAAGRQYRTMQLMTESRDADTEKKYIVKGYATTFNEPYVLYSDDDFEYREQVSPDAFKDTEMSDVIFQFDHEGRVFARISNNTLKLDVDEHGLLCTANLGTTELTRSLYEDIDKGLITKMSFGFTVAEDEELRTSENGKDVYLRTIKRVGKLFDVSCVSLPANDGTEISARSLVDGVIAKRMAEKAKEEADAQAKAEAEKAEEERKRQEEEAKEKARQERERLALELELSLTN